MGTLLFYILWPLVWFYAPLQARVRAIVLVDEEVIVVKNWFGPGNWQLPGGGIRFGESVPRAVRRELREELQLHIGLSNIHQVTEEAMLVNAYGLLMRYQYSITKLPHKPNIKIGHGVVDYGWIRLEDADIPHAVKAKLKQG